VLTVLAGEVARLQNGWNEVNAQLLSQRDMNERLAAEAGDLRGQNRKLAQQCGKLEMQIKELTGSGPADVDQPRTLARYEDDQVQLRYWLIDERFEYTVKPYRIGLSVVDIKGKVSAKAFDVRTGKEIDITRMDFAQVPESGKAWYRKVKIGLDAGYSDGLIVGAHVGYNKTRVIGGVRLDETLVPTVAVSQDLW
jgi:hypothetical protein